ncbi:MAG: hypothetical protein LBQ54_06615 [Planctomycetaceae bacterium]|jgi:hypothetical protein|nr:hypothetical protein [Planctomycetaceae bacterium]
MQCAKINNTAKMSVFLSIGLLLISVQGCISDPLAETIGLQAPTPPNPIFIVNTDSNYVWDRVVDAADDYFEIEREEPVRIYGNVLTEGRIDTKPLIAATYLEPWYKDSVTSYDRMESTFQTIQRKAVIRVIPENGGFSVSVAVYREIEDLQRPLRAITGSANFYNDSTIKPITEMQSGTSVSQGWISLGRDPALEQRILLKILYNISHPAKET